MRVTNVSTIVFGSPSFFKNKDLSVEVIRSFFSEVLNSLIEGKEVRFPKKGNGKLFLAVKHRSANDVRRMKHIKRDNLKNVFDGSVKPILHGFNANVKRKGKKEKVFSLKFSYPLRSAIKLQKHFRDNKKRRLLPEIQ